MGALEANGLRDAGGPTVHHGVWVTEVLTGGGLRRGPTCPKVPYNPVSLDLSHTGKTLLPGERGTPAGLSPSASPACRSGCSGPLLLGVAAVGDLGPPPTLGDGPAGAAGSHTKRLSNFLASVMCTQLSFSTTLMCFTSSLNLGKAHGSAGHYASHGAPGPPRGPGLLYVC